MFNKIAIIIFMIIITHYLLCYLHEFTHIIFCKILKCKIIKFKVGFLLYDEYFKFSIKGKNFCNFRTNNEKKALIILLSGPIINAVFLILFIILGLYISNKYFWVYTIGITMMNFISIVHDLYPKIDNDGKSIVLIIKKMKNRA